MTGTSSKWDKSGLHSLKMFEEAGVKFIPSSEIDDIIPLSA